MAVRGVITNRHPSSLLPSRWVFVLSLVLLTSLLATQGPTGPAVKYKFETKATTAIDLSAMGQGSQTVDMGSVSYFAITMSDSAGGRIARVVFDSVKVDAGALRGVLPDSLLKVKPGTVARLFIHHGQAMPLDGIEGLGMAGAQVLPAFQMLFPQVAANSVVGTSWADTAKADTAIATPDSIKAIAGDDIRIGSKSVTTWRVAAMDGEAWVLDAVTAGTSTMNMMGNEVQATTTGKQHVTIGKDGVARSGTMESKAAMAMAMGANTVQIDVTTTGALTKLP